MLKRVTSLLLCVLMAASCAFFVACEKDDGNASNTSVVGDTSGFLPEAKNWGGEAVTILGYKDDSRIYSQCQVDTEETNGESVNDAFYNRNELIKNNYGIDIELVLDENNNPIEMLRNDMTAGLNEIDAIMNGVHYLSALAVDGQFIDFNGDNIKYLNLNKPWWDQNIQEDLNLNGKCYFITGDALVNDDESTSVMYFNKGLVEANGLENVYDVVNDGKWTLDKMFEMADAVANDQTKAWGDGSTWGLLTQSYDLLYFMSGCDQLMIDNSGEQPTFRVDSTENQTTFQKIYDIVKNNKTVVSVAEDNKTGYMDGDAVNWGKLYDAEIKIFAEGQALFMANSLSLVNSTALRETDISFGIVPMPKKDDKQEDYVAAISVYQCAVFAVPMTNEGERLERTCYALEAMAYFGSTMVTDEYYTRTVSLKRLKDDRDSEMLDKIFSNKGYDMALVFNFGGESNPNVGALYFYSGVADGNITSAWEQQSLKFETALEDFIGLTYNS